MRIAIDCGIFEAWAGGVPRYISALGRSLAALGRDDVDLYLPEGISVPLVDEVSARRLSIRRLPHHDDPGRALEERLTAWQQVTLPDALDLDPPDVFLGPFYMCATRKTGWPKAVTVHDLIFQTHPEWFRRDEAWYRPEMADYLQQLGRASAGAADAVVCVSNVVAEDVRSLWLIPREKVFTVYPGSAFAGSGRDLGPAPRGPGSPYLLNVGGTDVRKNLDRLLRAFQDVRARVMPTLRLVLVNARREDIGADPELLRHVTCTPPVSDRELATWYRGALAFVLPSLEEGFGSANLEAMSLGTPVITSDLPVLREVLADAAMFVDPASVAELAAAIQTLVTSPATRRRLRADGLHRSARYSYESAAIGTRRILRGLCR